MTGCSFFEVETHAFCTFPGDRRRDRRDGRCHRADAKRDSCLSWLVRFRRHVRWIVAIRARGRSLPRSLFKTALRQAFQRVIVPKSRSLCSAWLEIIMQVKSARVSPWFLPALALPASSGALFSVVRKRTNQLGARTASRPAFTIYLLKNVHLLGTEENNESEN